MTQIDLDKEKVLAMAKEMDVEFIRLQFTDILGVLKNVAIPVQQLEKALDGEIMFDGSSIEGFVRIEESDMLLKPDPATFTIFPWRPRSGAVARLICDVYNADGTPFAGCPRLTLKRVLAEAEAMGYAFTVGPEIEFFLFLTDKQGRPTTYTQDRASYFDLAPVDLGENARRDMVLALQEMGFEVKASHHEVAPGQHEIDLIYNDGLRVADQIVTLKYAVRAIAQRHGLHASFMPKPIFGVAGSGMHLHLSLFKDRINVFYDPNSPEGLSDTALFFLGGLLRHVRGFTAITNSLVNSYKRLLSDFEAPRYINWSKQNHSPLIRVTSRPEIGTWLEVRSPDPCCNPYLALAVMLKAGLEGIRQQVLPPPPMKQSSIQLYGAIRTAIESDELPEDLGKALRELSRDELIQEALGPHIYQRFMEAKTIEWNHYRTQIHRWEINEYLNRF